ncbi:MAG: M48 family metallopeptidase [Pseudomonadota bacterium]
MSAKVKEIPYEVIRSRRKTADIVVERDGRVVVRAPDSLTDARIEDLIETKRYWIYKTLAEWRDLNARHVAREYRNGEGFLYLGRSYRLQLVRDQQEPVLLKNGRFCLRRELVDQGNAEAVQRAFRDYYIARGETWIEARAGYFAPKVGVQPKGVAVRELGFRWASCSPTGKLAFHWKCMMAPATIIDYIIVHELCHFHYGDHTAAFWNEVDKVLPSYRERKDWLRQHGASLDL